VVGCWRGKKKKFAKGERENSVVHISREVVGRLLVVKMVVVKSLVMVLVAEGHGGEREGGGESSRWQQKWGG
jgi:hypothetical protein